MGVKIACVIAGRPCTGSTRYIKLGCTVLYRVEPLQGWPATAQPILAPVPKSDSNDASTGIIQWWVCNLVFSILLNLDPMMTMLRDTSKSASTFGQWYILPVTAVHIGSCSAWKAVFKNTQLYSIAATGSWCCLRVRFVVLPYRTT